MRATTTQSPEALRVAIEPLIAREIISIGAIDAATPRQNDPGYTYLYHETKIDKQSNVQQLSTVLRVARAKVQRAAAVAELAVKAQAMLAQTLSTPATLRVMRVMQAELVNQYANAVDNLHGDAQRAVAMCLGRALTSVTVLTAHVARLTASDSERPLLPRGLGEYFASEQPRVCMRCLLDRPGRSQAILRRDPHPYTYICAACVDEVRVSFPREIAEQVERAREDVREARITQKALSKPSRVKAAKQVLFPLSGLQAIVSVPPATKAVDLPEAWPVPGPVDEPPAVVEVEQDTPASGETVYVRDLFDYRSVRRYW
jgi:hypothetical protein